MPFELTGRLLAVTSWRHSEQVTQGFAGSLRERVDSEGVVAGWLGVVEETMQPAAVDVWVKETLDVS